MSRMWRNNLVLNKTPPRVSSLYMLFMPFAIRVCFLHGSFYGFFLSRYERSLSILQLYEKKKKSQFVRRLIYYLNNLKYKIKSKKSNNIYQMILEDHFCVSIRTSSCYSYFNIIQLILTSGVLIMCYQSNLNYASLLEILVTFCLAADLMIRNFSQSSFLKNRSNLYDFVLLITMITTMIIHQMKPHFQHFTHTNRYLALFLIVVRYCSQLTRLLLIVVKARENRNLSKVEEISFHQMGNHKLQIEDNLSTQEVSVFKKLAI